MLQHLWAWIRLLHARHGGLSSAPFQNAPVCAPVLSTDLLPQAPCAAICCTHCGVILWVLGSSVRLGAPRTAELCLGHPSVPHALQPAKRQKIAAEESHLPAALEPSVLGV